MRARPLLRTALAAALALLWAPGTARAPGDVVPPLAGAEALTAEVLLADPESWIDRPLRLCVQLESVQEAWNPWMTRYGPGEYLAVQGWTDAQRPWLREEWERPALRFFVRRDGPLAATFRAAGRHWRFEVVLVPRELFAGRPWGEAVSARRLAEELCEGSILHVIRARRLAESGAFEAAIAELERALAAPLPPEPRAELARLESLYRLGRLE